MVGSVVMLIAGALVTYNPFLFLDEQSHRDMEERFSKQWVQRGIKMMRVGGILVLLIGLYGLVKRLVL